MDIYLDELVDIFRKNPTVRLGVGLMYGMAVIGQRQRFDVDEVQTASDLYRDRKITKLQLGKWMHSRGYEELDFRRVLEKIEEGKGVSSKSKSKQIVEIGDDTWEDATKQLVSVNTADVPLEQQDIFKKFYGVQQFGF